MLDSAAVCLLIAVSPMLVYGLLPATGSKAPGLAVQDDARRAIGNPDFAAWLALIEPHAEPQRPQREASNAAIPASFC